MVDLIIYFYTVFSVFKPFSHYHLRRWILMSEIELGIGYIIFGIYLIIFGLFK